MSGMTFDMHASYLVRQAYYSLSTKESEIARTEVYGTDEITSDILWNRIKAYSIGAVIPFDVPEWSRDLLARLAFARSISTQLAYGSVEYNAWRDHEVKIYDALYMHNRNGRSLTI